MKKLSHKEWHSHVTRLKAALQECPDDLDRASEFWNAIDGSLGFDVRDGKRLIDTFRACAFKSDEGLAKLVVAFRKFVEDSGEFPDFSLFDPPLENLLRSVARQPDHKLSADAIWILGFIDADL